MGDWIGDKLADAIQAAAEAGVDLVLWFLDTLWGIVQGLTSPQVNADFMYAWAGRIFYISLPLLALIFVAQLLHAVSRRSTSELGKAVTGMIIAVIGTIISLPMVAYLTRGFDTLADGLIDTAMEDTRQGFSQPLFGDASGSEIFGMVIEGIGIAGAGGLATAIIGGMFIGLFASLVIVGSLALFLALLIRSNLLYIMVVIGPIMLAGIPWRVTQKWAVRWISIVVALIFTKLGVVIVMAVGSGALTSALVGGFAGEEGQEMEVLELMGQFLGAGVMLMVAALTPVATFAFFDFLGENAVGSLHADARRPIDTAKQSATQHLRPSMLSGHSTPSTPVSSQGGTGGPPMANTRPAPMPEAASPEGGQPQKPQKQPSPSGPTPQGAPSSQEPSKDAPAPRSAPDPPAPYGPNYQVPHDGGPPIEIDPNLASMHDHPPPPPAHDLQNVVPKPVPRA